MRSAIITLALAVMGIPSLQASIDQPEILRTSFNRKDPTLQKICQTLAPQLTVKTGPMGLGVFESVDCNTETADNFFSPLDWRLKISSSGENIQLKIERKSESKFNTIAETTIAKSEFLNKILEQSDFASLMALSLLDQLPYAGIVSAQELNQKRVAAQKFPHSTLTNRYRETMIYSVETDPTNLFMVPSVLAEGTLKGSNKGKTENQFWSLSKVDLTGHFGHAWIHTSAGPGGLKDQLQQEISERQSYLDHLASKGNIKEEIEKENRPWEQSYAGIRYGISILSSSPPIKKQTLLGVDLQHKSSWGGRVDYVGKAKGTKDGFGSYAGWSRFLIEKQIVEPIKTDYFDAILLRPHVGLFSFNGSFPDEETFMNMDFVTYKYSNMFDLGGSAIFANYSRDYHIYAGYTLDFGFKNVTFKRPLLLAHRIDAEFRYLGIRRIDFLPHLLRDPYFSAFYQMDVFNIYGTPQFDGDTGGTLIYSSNFIGGGIGFVF